MIGEVNKFIKKIVLLNTGFVLVAIGVSLSVKAKIGIGPWDVLHQGLSNTFNISIGLASMIVGFTILLLASIIKVYPGLATVLNILVIGTLIDIFMNLVPDSSSTLMSYLMVIGSVITLSLGSVLYLIASLGAGPRDSLMIGLIQKFQVDTTYVKPVIEITVTVIGLLLGGNFGVGTFIILLSMGYFMDVFFKMFKYDPKKRKQLNFAQQLNYVKGVI